MFPLSLFPRLAGDGFQQTSSATPRYNCIAWAAGADDAWWEPALFGPYYWPPALPRGDYSVANYSAAFASCGYMRCEDGTLEPSLEKIAIFVAPDGSATHAARQLPDGSWTSKMGKGIDIAHPWPGSVEGPQYGAIAVYMSRTRQSTLF